MLPRRQRRGTLRSFLPMSESLSGLHLVLREIMGSRSYFDRTCEEHSVNMIEPGLYLGDGCTAMDRRYLKREGYTHVLNMAEGNGMGFVNTDESFYKNVGITYLGIRAHDMMSYSLDRYFLEAIQFIDNALARGGKILVHCVQGVSRSATIVIAYLITKKKMRASTALRYVFDRRWIRPNDGFLKQLASYSNNQETRLSLH